VTIRESALYGSVRLTNLDAGCQASGVTLCYLALWCVTVRAIAGARFPIGCYRVRWFDPTHPTIMASSIRLGDYLTEAQLRTLFGEKTVEQRKRDAAIGRKKSHSELSGVDAIRARVQWERHKRQRGEWKSRKPYLSTEDAIARYERAGERLESGEQMFRIGQGQATRKHTDIRATAVKGGRPGHGGRITHRPTIEDGLRLAAVATGKSSAAHYQWMARR